VKFQGNLTKSDKWWAVDMPILDLHTQGKTKKEAYEMAIDVVKCMSPIESIELVITPGESNSFEIGSNNTKAMVAILLKCRRQKSGMSIGQVASKLSLSSRNGYAKYEQGKNLPSVEKLEQMLDVMDASITFSEAS
jgi:hypothetical protein